MYHLSPLACLTGFYVLLGIGGLAHPPAEVLRRVAIPILIIHSGRDTSVSPQVVVDMAQWLSQAGQRTP